MPSTFLCCRYCCRCFSPLPSLFATVVAVPALPRRRCSPSTSLSLLFAVVVALRRRRRSPPSSPFSAVWRARLVEALKAINDSELAGQATNKNSGGVSISNEESLPLKVTADQESNSVPVVGTVSSKDKSSGPVQQLVAMFGALVAQGEKAAGSLEILISSISSDLLAEVVMANMQHLPPTCPKTDKDDVASETGYPSCLASSVLPSIQLSHFAFHLQESHQISEEKVMDTVETTLLSSSVGDGSAMMPAILPASVSPFPVVTQNGSSAVSLSLNSATEERVIPGVDSTSSTDEIQESHDASHSSNPEVNDSSQDHATSLGSLVPSNVLSTCSMATDVLETQSTGVGIFDTSQASSTASLVTSCQYVLPKMMILDVNLTDEAKDQLQKVAFVRILDAYKQVAISGGLDARCSLLVHLGIEVYTRA
ncbi:hypothetical protein BHM03_00053818 [Ensete ventricosum]|nr:hypothetical protein BHM03_00053818 [Ensete ventricosum]